MLSTAQRNPGVLLLVSGSTAAGKTTLIKEFIDTTHSFKKQPSVTTRPPRPDEINGLHYLFVTEHEFDLLQRQNALAEWAKVHGKHRYGTLKQPLAQDLADGCQRVLDIDVQGRRTIVQKAAEFLPSDVLILSIFIKAPLEELVGRLKKARPFMEQDELERRLASVEKENEAQREYDHVIENPDGHINLAVHQMEEFVVRRFTNHVSPK